MRRVTRATLAGTALVSAVLLATVSTTPAQDPGGPLDKVAPVVKLQAEPFPLGSVRLLDGPLKKAMELDRKKVQGWMSSDPMFDSLKGEPEFESLV